MIFLKIYWIIVMVMLAVMILSRYSNKLKVFREKYLFLILLFAGSFLIVAIVTDDPIEIFGITVPMEMQWLGSLLMFGGISWLLYLGPLKGKVYELDREVGEIKRDVKTLKEDMLIVKQKILSL